MYIKTGIKITFILTLMIISYIMVLPVLIPKTTESLTSEYNDYPKDTFDVIFVGSSVVMNAIYPLQLYDEYGIASYNLGCGSQQFVSSYYLMKEVIREQEPDLIVFDVFMCGFDDLVNENTHYVTDYIHYPEKAELIFASKPRDEWLDYFIEMRTYHDRWNSLTIDDFNKGTVKRDGAYGAKIHNWTGSLDSFGTISEEKKELPPGQEKILLDMITLCRENNVKLLFTLLPCNYSGGEGEWNRMESQGYWNMIQDIADDHGVSYLNFMYHYDELGLDLHKDTDGGTHMNIYGAPKVTRYIGKYIKEHYEIPDVRNDQAYAFMRKDFLEFRHRLTLLDNVN